MDSFSWYSSNGIITSWSQQKWPNTQVRETQSKTFLRSVFEAEKVHVDLRKDEMENICEGWNVSSAAIQSVL